MNRYSLSASAPFTKDSDNKTTIASLTEELLKLAVEFGGRSDPMCQSSSRSYERRYLDLIDPEHHLEVKVNELKERYSKDRVRFTLAEYTQETGQGPGQVGGGSAPEI